MVTNYPIQQLIESRCSELNISDKELIVRTGYSNINVGLKRLQQLFDADFQSARYLIEQLPTIPSKAGLILSLQSPFIDPIPRTDQVLSRNFS